MFSPTSASSSDPLSDSGSTQFQLYVGKGSRMSGTLRIHGEARVDGFIEGEIVCDSLLYLGKDAVIVADIRAEQVLAQGPVRGDIIVEKKLELLKPATVEGSINTPVFTLEEGVKIMGRLNMGMA